MTIQPIHSATPIPDSYTAEKYAEMIIESDFSVLDKLSMSELLSIKVRGPVCNVPLICCLLKSKNSQFLEKAWDRFLDALSLDEWMTPVVNQIPLLLVTAIADNEIFTRIWSKFRADMTPEFLLKIFLCESKPFTLALAMFETSHALDAWNVVSNHITVEDLCRREGVENLSELEVQLFTNNPRHPLLDAIFTKFAEQFSGVFFCRRYLWLTLGDRLVDLSPHHPQYLLAVWEKIPLFAGFSSDRIAKLIKAIILHKPELFPTLLEKLCTEAPSDLAYAEFTDAIWEQFHASVENKPVVAALFMLACGKVSEFESCVKLSTCQLVFTDAQLEYIVRFPQYFIAKANNEFVVDWIECSKQQEFSIFDIERLEKRAHKAHALGCVNVWYFLGMLLERDPRFEVDKLEAFSRVPTESPYYYQNVLSKLQSGYFSRAFSGPETDTRLLLEKSLGFALKLPQDGRIEARAQAIQEIASYYIGIAKGVCSLERDVVPQHIIEKISRTTTPQTLFSIFDEIKAERALEAQKQLLLAENQKLSRQISLLSKQTEGC